MRRSAPFLSSVAARASARAATPGRTRPIGAFVQAAWIAGALALAAGPAPQARAQAAPETAPLPPARVKDKPAPPARAAARRRPKASAPLPPRRPPELLAEEEKAAAEQQARAEPAPPSAPFAFPPLFAPAPADAPAASTAGESEAGKEPGQGPEKDQAEKDGKEAAGPQAAPEAGAGAPATPPAKGLPAACAALVEAGVITAEPETHLDVKAGCSLPSPVRLSAVRLKDGRLAPFKPAAILRCEMVAAVAEWVREDLAPALTALGTRMEAVKVAASFACRPRNNVRGARLSEHGFGNALDVGGFEMAGDAAVVVKNSGFPVALQRQMKASACQRFSTVLGPGSDGYHEDHIHVDLAERRNAYKLCRWIITEKPATLATPPLPKTRPFQAPDEAAAPPSAKPDAEPGAKSAAKSGSKPGSKSGSKSGSKPGADAEGGSQSASAQGASGQRRP